MPTKKKVLAADVVAEILTYPPVYQLRMDFKLYRQGTSKADAPLRRYIVAVTYHRQMLTNLESRLKLMTHKELKSLFLSRNVTRLVDIGDGMLLSDITYTVELVK